MASASTATAKATTEEVTAKTATEEVTAKTATEDLNQGPTPSDGGASPPRNGGGSGNNSRRESLNLPPEVVERMLKRRTSLDKLQPGKPVAPWMLVYDYPTENSASK